MLTQAERYLILGLPKVEGWLNPYSAEFILLLSRIQVAAGLRGAVGEIGVHHGKLFIVLLLARLADEKAFAIDVFEQQEMNTDGSGLGDRARFQANIRAWTGVEDIAVLAKSSLEVAPEEILTAVGPVRMASVDGGHTAECAFNDLMLMDKVVAEHGIVILDDYFNHEWPDVSTGASRYMALEGTMLRPFAISPNKLYLCRPDYSRFYRDRIAGIGRFGHPKPSRMFESDVDIYMPPPPTTLGGTLVQDVLKPSRLGIYLLAAKTTLSRRKRLPEAESLKGPER